jgi:hypothetical protein
LNEPFNRSTHPWLMFWLYEQSISGQTEPSHLPNGHEEEDLHATVQAQRFGPQVSPIIAVLAQLLVNLLDDEDVEPGSG